MERFYGKKPEMMWIDINKLNVNQKYQRDVTGRRSKVNIEFIMNNFSWDKFTPITVVKTDAGDYNIIDGQHRYEAAKALGDIKELPCWVICKTDVKKQAETFMGINKNRVYTNAYDLFKAEIAAGDKQAVAISQFCDKAGVIIPFNGYCSLPCMTLALATIRKHLNLHNDGYLINAINIIRKAFPKKIGQLKSDILNTLVEIRIEYGQKIKDEELINTLIAFGNVDQISAKARELKALDNSLSATESHKKVFISKTKEVRKK
jgi:hypothetical protein